MKNTVSKEILGLETNSSAFESVQKKKFHRRNRSLLDQGKGPSLATLDSSI
jgi:hypothetical protein